VLAKKLLYRLIYGVVAVQVLLLVVDRFPAGLSALSVVSHGIYAQNLRRFPIVKLTDPLFLLSCGMPISLWCLSQASGRMLMNVYSPRNRKSLPLVPSLQRAAREYLLLIYLYPRRQHSHLHRDRILLRPLRLACSLRIVRLPICRRKRPALDGLRIRDWRRKQLYDTGESAGLLRQWVRRRSRRGQQRYGGKEAGQERNKCRYGEGCRRRRQRMGGRDRRSHGILEGREDEAYILKRAGSITWIMSV
jgi:hypothetical protein